MTVILPNKFKEYGVKYILSIGRRQPMHIGHKRSLAKILAIPDVTVIYVIGSSNIFGDPLFDPFNNPLNLHQQMEQFHKVFPEKKVIFLPIIDVANISDWGPAIIAALKEFSITPSECIIHFVGKPEDRIKEICKFTLPNGEEKELVEGQWLIEVLSYYGFSIWFDQDIPVELGISARQFRQLDLEKLTDEQEKILAAPEYLKALAQKARERNPEQEGKPITLYDLTLDRIKREKN